MLPCSFLFRLGFGELSLYCRKTASAPREYHDSSSEMRIKIPVVLHPIPIFPTTVPEYHRSSSRSCQSNRLPIEVNLDAWSLIPMYLKSQRSASHVFSGRFFKSSTSNIQMRLRSFIALGLAVSHAQAGYFNSTSCSSLTNVTIANTTIRFATSIIAGSNFTGDSPETSYNTVQTALPAACRVACEIKTSRNFTARFEVRLPDAEAWNSRFLATGNGGWAGGINYADIVTGLKKGMVTEKV